MQEGLEHGCDGDCAAVNKEGDPWVPGGILLPG